MREGLIDRIQRLRGLASLSARELGGLAGLHHAHVSLLEKGDGQRVSVSTIFQIAEVFRVSLDWLIKGAGEEPTAEHVRAAVSRARRSRRRALAPEKTGTSG
jgi:transcriptional regulator with XRE-family HTH domain